MGEAGEDSESTGEEEGHLRRRLKGRLGNGGFTATGGLGLEATRGPRELTPGGERSRPCSSSIMSSEAPSGKSSRSVRETERRRMFRSSFVVTTGRDD